MKKELRRVTKLPPRIHRGVLAEDYDGIGRYVKVMLSRGSTSVAQKVRVAAGDFGGGRKIPAGSTVNVASYRGQMEVFLGNQPRAFCDFFNRGILEPDFFFEEDAFNRVVSGSWNGGPWTLDYNLGTPAPTLSVNGSAAVLLGTGGAGVVGSAFATIQDYRLSPIDLFAVLVGTLNSDGSQFQFGVSQFDTAPFYELAFIIQRSFTSDVFLLDVAYTSYDADFNIIDDVDNTQTWADDWGATELTVICGITAGGLSIIARRTSFLGQRTITLAQPIVDIPGDVYFQLGAIGTSNTTLRHFSLQKQASNPGWGRGPIGTWYTPDEYYRLNPQPLIWPYDSTTPPGTGGEIADADIYESYYLLGGRWDSRLFVEEGYGKIGYQVVDGDEEVFAGGDPTALLEIRRLPKRVVMDFRGSPTATSAEFQVYFGYHHHWVWDEWIGFYININRNDDYEVFPFEGFQTNVDVWEVNGDSYFDIDQASPAPGTVQDLRRVVIDMSESGFYLKIWRLEAEPEPSNYQAGWDWNIAPDTDYFHFMYIEQFTSANIGEDSTEESVLTWFDKICVYYGARYGVPAAGSVG